MKLLKVYRYIDSGDDAIRWKRELFDALVIPDHGGLSSPLGDDEEFEVYIEEIE